MWYKVDVANPEQPGSLLALDTVTQGSLRPCWLWMLKLKDYSSRVDFCCLQPAKLCDFVGVEHQALLAQFSVPHCCLGPPPLLTRSTPQTLSSFHSDSSAQLPWTSYRCGCSTPPHPVSIRILLCLQPQLHPYP